MNIPFTQTKEYLSWHNSVNNKTIYLEFFRDISESEDFQIDEENSKEKYAAAACVILNLRIGKVLYVPYGPHFILPLGKGELEGVIKKLHDLGVQENCVFVRLEDENNFFKTLPFLPLLRGGIVPPKKTFAKEGIFQPRMEWWLDLGENEEELLNRVHKDHRYSIRRAQKENVETEIININHDLDEMEKEKYFNIFWDLLKETSERDGFSLYDENYYKEIFHSPRQARGVEKFVVFTKFKSKYLSVALIVISDKIANLVFAGSASEKRESGYNHLMQWEAIKNAKELGCKTYNFGGITENGYGKQSLEGVTKFKKKFGGYAKFHGNFKDIPIKKIKYFLYIFKKLF